MAFTKSHTGNHSKNLAFTHCRGEEKDTRSSTSGQSWKARCQTSCPTEPTWSRPNQMSIPVLAEPYRQDHWETQDSPTSDSILCHSMGQDCSTDFLKMCAISQASQKMAFKSSLDSLLSHINDEPQLLQYSNSNQVQSNSLLHHKFPVQEQPNRCGKSTLIEGQWAWMQSTSNK